MLASARVQEYIKKGIIKNDFVLREGGFGAGEEEDGDDQMFEGNNMEMEMESTSTSSTLVPPQVFTSDFRDNLFVKCKSKPKNLGRKKQCSKH